MEFGISQSSGASTILRQTILCGLYRTSFEHLSGRLCLESHRLLGEGIDAFVGLGGGLLDHDELCKAGHHEFPGFSELLVSDVRKRFEHALHVLSCQLLRMPLGDRLNEFGFGLHVPLQGWRFPSRWGLD